MTDQGRVFIAGHRGLVGSALYEQLSQRDDLEIAIKPHKHLDLIDQKQVDTFFKNSQIDCVYLAAAKVGGILANTLRPAEFIRDNLMIQANVIDSAFRHGVEKLLFLGSSCIYPRDCPQPIKEEYLMTGPLELTNDAYAVAKIAGIKMCQSYRRQYGFDAISVMPTNLYGPRDNFDLETAHVLPALMRKVHEAHLDGAREVVIWGTGSPRREFLHVSDLADACIHLMAVYSDEAPINVGTGQDVAISELAVMLRELIGYKGTFTYDRTKPDGTPRKIIDVRRLHETGWRHNIPLVEGLSDTYAWFQHAYGKTIAE